MVYLSHAFRRFSKHANYAGFNKNKKITVCGNQIITNIHIHDICDAYVFLLENPEINGIYNAGFENISILDIAKIIQSKNSMWKLNVSKSNDPRSYRLDSSKLLSTGFKPKKNVEIAIEEIIEAHASKLIFDKSHCYNLYDGWRLSLKRRTQHNALSKREIHVR